MEAPKEPVYKAYACCLVISQQLFIEGSVSNLKIDMICKLILNGTWEDKLKA